MTATRLVGLLRAVNLGPASTKLAMSDLRDAVASLGHSDVTTYIQSGNVVFTTDRPAGTVAGRVRIAAGIQSALADRVGRQVPVVVRSADELRAALDAVPFGDEPEPAKVHIMFLTARPSKAAVAALDRDRFAPERFEVIGREMYLHYPNGAGRSKMTPAFFAKLGVDGTSRNLNTVRKLLALALAS